MEPCAVLHVSGDIVPLIEKGFLPIFDVNRISTLNDLWIDRGKFGTECYCYGTLTKWTIRQLRGHRFIFVSTKKRIHLKDTIITPDVVISQQVLSGGLKELETVIGFKSIGLRKNFGDQLRKYALLSCRFLNGSEAETLNVAEPNVHKVRGHTMEPPTHLNLLGSYENDGPTDEKLVSLIDYITYSADQIYYVGCGDLRTLKLFAKRDKRRFNRVRWFCFDPIAPESFAENVLVRKTKIESYRDLKKYMDDGTVERVLIWDVSGDGKKGTIEWEQQRASEDRMGEQVAKGLAKFFSFAVIKHRIPKDNEVYSCYSSLIVPQPGAAQDMYECRNIIKLEGFSKVDSTHLGEARIHYVSPKDLRLLIHRFHGFGRGRKLKKSIFEYLHIERVNGLDSLDEPRADLFYLTNHRNATRAEDIRRVVEQSTISILWVGKRPLYDYPDFRYPRCDAMLRFSNITNRVFDGNGALLYLMWNYPEKFSKKVNYDPAWAENYCVILKEDIPRIPVLELSLCRFIGLRTVSTMMRVQTNSVHQISDKVKKMGLDLSGHLFIALMSDSYISDIMWWFDMILNWSVLNRVEKKRKLFEMNAEVIEWKEDRANEPWHIKPDLIAALIEFSRFTSVMMTDEACVTKWILYLRSKE
uniref:Core protein VP4 n=1 Tax=Chuzan virus TaxID=77204 RepID=A0A4D6K394_9REOV|nr:minor core protein [Chuzan virus]QCD25266.1 minor core protein [Chuzan virus]